MGVVIVRRWEREQSAECCGVEENVVQEGRAGGGSRCDIQLLLSL